VASEATGSRQRSGSSLKFSKELPGTEDYPSSRLDVELLKAFAAVTLTRLFAR